MISELPPETTDLTPGTIHASDWADDIIATASLVAITWFVARRAIAWWRATPERPHINLGAVTAGHRRDHAGADGAAPAPASASPTGEADPAAAQRGADPAEDPLSTRAF